MILKGAENGKHTVMILNCLKMFLSLLVTKFYSTKKITQNYNMVSFLSHKQAVFCFIRQYIFGSMDHEQRSSLRILLEP